MMPMKSLGKFKRQIDRQIDRSMAELKHKITLKIFLNKNKYTGNIAKIEEFTTLFCPMTQNTTLFANGGSFTPQKILLDFS